MDYLLPISYEETRSLVIRAISKNPEGQLEELRYWIAEMAVETIGKPTNNSGETGLLTTAHGHVILNDVSLRRIESILWDLIIEGVVRPGSQKDCSTGLPFYHVTAFGHARIEYLHP